MEPGETVAEAGMLIEQPAEVLVQRAGEIEAQESLAMSLLEEAHLVQVRDVTEYEYAVGFVRRLRLRLKDVQEFFEPMRKSTHAAWKSVTSRTAEVARPIEDAISVVETELSAYQTEQARLAREAAAEERRQAAEEAERQRAEAFDKAVEEGDEEKAEAILGQAGAPVASSAAVSAAEQLEMAAPKQKGTVVREVWTGEVVDLGEFLRAVIEGAAPTHLIEVNQSALDKLAQQTKGTMAIAGVEFRSTEKITVRSR